MPMTPTDKELNAIKELRQRIVDVEAELDDFQKHDYTLLRFLRARDLNVDKAELLLRNNIKWRKEQRPDKVSWTELDPEILKRFPFKLSGYDAEGSYILIFPVGQCDYRWVMNNDKNGAYRQFVMRTSELGYELFKHKSTPENFVCQAVSIMDYDGFSLKQFMSPTIIQAMKELMTELEANYPEVVKASIIVNAPKVFSILFSIMKPLLTKSMIEKMQIYGPNPEQWRSAVRKLAPADQIPSQYGGANTTCFNYSYEDGYDLTPKLVTLPEEDMEQVVISAGEKKLFDFEIPAAGTTFNWNFKTDDYDVGFFVYYDSVSSENEIISCPRCDSHINVQKGSLPCHKAGNYILSFDNSYSKFRSKTLYYVTQIVPPT